jgi:hypothetical protein
MDKVMSDLKNQAKIVKQNLIYHLMDSSGNWMLPDNMKFLNEVLNDVMKLCKLANDVDKSTEQALPIQHVRQTLIAFRAYWWSNSETVDEITDTDIERYLGNL